MSEADAPVRPAAAGAANGGPATPRDPEVVQAVAGFSAGSGLEARFARQVAERRVERDAIIEMLLQHVTPGVDPVDAEVVARALATGCLGEQHLWRDLELPSRTVLRKLFEAYFEPFAADNVMDMRWKKFVYRRLCRWGGFNTCTAPSCAACSSYAECFGPEA